jgi:hypothetical protein
MVLICPKCKTHNRSIAKFCIECITSLPTGCADVDFAPTVNAAPQTSYLELALAMKAAWSKNSARSEAEVRQEAAPVAKGMWISVAGLIAVLLIGSAGWLVAGAGGWYLYSAGSAQVDPPRPHSPSVGTTRPGGEPADMSAPAASSSNHVHVPVQLAPAVENSEILHSEIDRPVPAPSLAIKRASPAGQAPASVASPPIRNLAAPPAFQARPPMEADVPKSSAAPEPESACKALNFIARSQCMAAQCLRREFRSHAQCEAVRRQQRLEEEKRNPPAP